MSVAGVLFASYAGCLLVESERIEARHLATRWAAFGSAPAEAFFGYAPRFGVRRVVTAEQVRQFGTKLGVASETTPGICVERPARLLERAEVATALRHAFPPSTRIEVMEFSGGPVPIGDLRFAPRAGGDPERPSLIRGQIVGTGSSRFPVWALAKVSVEQELLVAARPIAAGEIVRDEALRVETRRVTPGAEMGFHRPAEASGFLAARPIAEGQVVSRPLLRRVREVVPGDAVAVEAAAGAAVLRVAAKAESGGRRGERIVLRNPESGRRFGAVVTGPKQARVEQSDAIH